MNSALLMVSSNSPTVRLSRSASLNVNSAS